MSDLARAAYVGLGANLGDAAGTLQAAFDALASLPGTTLTARSSLYRSAPVDAAGPDFFNAVAALRTTFEPLQLLHALQAIEHAHGRQRPYRNAPRTLDLDLLCVDGVVLQTAELTLPHPRLHERAFVLVPLAELAPTLELPGLGRLAPWIERAAQQRLERVPGD